MTSLFDLSGKTAIVTGSSRGIGRAIAIRFAEHGANVVISSRKADACGATSRQIIEKYGSRRSISIPANIGSKQELENLVEGAALEFGRIDILVCNAATNPFLGPMSQISDAQFAKILNNNIVSNHWLSQMVVPYMRRQGEGAIVFISSIGGFRGSSEHGAYDVSKAADMQLARNLAVELGPDNIRVNAIAPGYVKTDFARALWEDDARHARLLESIPLKRLGEPDDIAGISVYLASPAGRYATGQTFIIDGGLLA